MARLLMVIYTLCIVGVASAFMMLVLRIPTDERWWVVTAIALVSVLAIATPVLVGSYSRRHLQRQQDMVSRMQSELPNAIVTAGILKISSRSKRSGLPRFATDTGHHRVLVLTNFGIEIWARSTQRPLREWELAWSEIQSVGVAIVSFGQKYRVHGVEIQFDRGVGPESLELVPDFGFTSSYESQVKELADAASALHSRSSSR